MTSEDSTARAVGLPSRSVDWRSEARGGPRSGVLQPVAQRLGKVDGDAGDGRASGATDAPGAGAPDRAAAGPVAVGSAPGTGTASSAVGDRTSLTPSGKHRTSPGRSRRRCELSWRPSPCCMVRCTSSSWDAGGSVRGWPSAWPNRATRVAIIDKARRAFRRLPARLARARTVVGSGFDRDDLDRAGRRTAGALAAVTSGDNSNILTARIARENYGIPNVVARIYDPRRAEIYQRLGHPHRRHRDVDHRPGAAPAAAGDGRR